MMNFQFANLIKNSPALPGVYMMYDADNTLLYIGKAKNIHVRLRQYINVSKLEWHKRVMRNLVANIDWQITATESDALILEQELIKTLKPKYNIMLTDGKMYPMMALTKHKYPRLIKIRKKLSQTKDVFGPYPSVNTLNEALKTIQKVCQLRTCTDSFMNNRTRPCLLHQINRCSAPCINGKNYEQQVKLARKILSGNVQSVVKKLSEQMQTLSKKQQYEAAAQIRDKISALTTTANRGKPNFQITNTFSESFNELEKWLGIKIESAAVFDNSHLFGKNPVGAMIVFGKNGFIKSKYRHFKLRNIKNAGNDIAMMQEFLSRAEKHQLVIVDGGRAQWNIAKKVLGNNSTIISVVKGNVRDGDECFIMPDGSENHKLPKDSKLFLMLRRVRDEAHRFAISFHRNRRAKTEFTSALDEIDGIGPIRKKALLHYFGSVKQIADTSETDIARVPGISKSLAKKIYEHFH